MKKRGKTDEIKHIVAKIEGQNPISSNEMFDILDIISGIMFLRIKTNNEYGKKRLTETIEELWKRIEALKNETIYRYVNYCFIVKYVSFKLKHYLTHTPA